MKINGAPPQPTDAEMRQMMRAMEERLKMESAGAARFEVANLDPNGGGDFILLGAISPLSLNKTAIRMNHAQALAFCGLVCQTMAMMMARAGHAPPTGT